MPVSRAQMKATKKYQQANYDRAAVYLKKGTKDRIKAISSLTINAYIAEAVYAALEKDERAQQPEDDFPFNIPEEITLDDMFE